MSRYCLLDAGHCEITLLPSMPETFLVLLTRLPQSRSSNFALARVFGVVFYQSKQLVIFYGLTLPFVHFLFLRIVP